MDNGDEKRSAIHQFIQELGPADSGERRAVLTGWAIICDWMDEDGERWLSKAHSETVPVWVANGYHHEALYGDWPSPDDGDE